jgi:hypothetical protein
MSCRQSNIVTRSWSLPEKVCAEATSKPTRSPTPASAAFSRARSIDSACESDPTTVVRG